MKTAPKYNLIVVLGPTATGKTRFASALAVAVDGEIISADSRQVYRKMNIGTGKDYNDYIVDGTEVPYHLIDIHDPGYKYNVFEFQNDFANAWTDIIARKKMPILCGGTGMYIEAVTQEYKLTAVPVNKALRDYLKNKSLPELEQLLSTYKKLHNKTDTDTVKRAIRAIEIEDYYKNNPEIVNKPLNINPVYLGINVDREIRRNRISERLYSRLKEGMISEVNYLLESGVTPGDLMYYGLEYKYITLYLTGKLEYEEMVQQLEIAIHQFAKRQMTWFRKMERSGIIIHWIDGILSLENKVELTLNIINV